METAGIIVFVVSGAVLLALPGLFLWMLWHTSRERRRWRSAASHAMQLEALEQERNEQAHRQRRRKERERELRERRGGVVGEWR